jgi:hypothetical protein
MHRLRVRLLLREWLSWGAGKGLLLMPTVFGTLISYVEPPWPYALVYPARGIADLLGPVARAPGGEALSRLVGPRRADVLRALTRTRAGRAVRYEHTPLGAALADS